MSHEYIAELSLTNEEFLQRHRIPHLHDWENGSCLDAKKQASIPAGRYLRKSKLLLGRKLIIMLIMLLKMSWWWMVYQEVRMWAFSLGFHEYFQILHWLQIFLPIPRQVFRHDFPVKRIIIRRLMPYGRIFPRPAPCCKACPPTNRSAQKASTYQAAIRIYRRKSL